MTALESGQMAAGMPTLLSQALDYVARGWYVLPCRVQQKTRASGEVVKDVRLPRHWDQKSTRDPATVQAWFAPGGEWADGSVAIDTGKSGLVVVDLDCTGGKNGFKTWTDLGGYSAGYVVATPSGGAHLFYAADPNRPVGIDSSGKLGPGIDIRGVGGLVIAAPSSDWRGSYREVDPQGWRYLTIVPDIVAQRVPLGGAAAPQPVAATPAERQPTNQLATFHAGDGLPKYRASEADRRITAALDKVRRTAEGQGFNHTLNEAAYELGHWVAGGHLDIADAESLLVYVVTEVFPGGPNGDDLATIDSGLRSGQGKPYLVLTPSAGQLLPQEKTAGPGFSKLPVGSITNREPIPPPSVYDPGSGPLLYAEGVHWLFGESGSGKTWVALDAIARVLKSGGSALMVDYEDTQNAILDRLAALGVDDQQIGQLAYVNGYDITVQDLVNNLAVGEHFDISVLDGVTTSITEFGAASNDSDDVTRWANAIPRAMTGSVICVDHVTKNGDTRGGYAIGSQAKRAVVTGASYEAVCDVPLRKGADGRIRLVLRKDKRGGIGVAVGDVAALLEFSSSADGLHMRTGVVSAHKVEETPGPVDPRVLLVATVLEKAHNEGTLNLEDGVRKLTEWIRGHGHLMEGGSARKGDVGEAIRFARGWAGLPHVADKYRIRPLSPICPPGDTPLVDQGVPQDQLGVPQDHGDSGDT